MTTKMAKHDEEHWYCPVHPEHKLKKLPNLDDVRPNAIVRKWFCTKCPKGYSLLDLTGV